MPKLFSELRERLLRDGVAPRHVRRYLHELADHLADLRAEEEHRGCKPADAEAAALVRLGGIDELSKAMTGRKEFQSWCVRAPWAMFGFAPCCFLAAVYLMALLILWSGWQLFLPGNDMPFVRVDGLASFYFGVGRLLYFSAPVLVGWGIGVLAVRQRLSGLWPAIGLMLVALIGGTAQVQASRTAVSGGLGHIRMDLALGNPLYGVPVGLFHALVIVSLGALPYLIWRLQRTLLSSEKIPH